MVFNIIKMIVTTLITIYTISFAVFEWRQKNKLGSAMVTLVNIVTVFLVAYNIFFR